MTHRQRSSPSVRWLDPHLPVALRGTPRNGPVGTPEVVLRAGTGGPELGAVVGLDPLNGHGEALHTSSTKAVADWIELWLERCSTLYRVDSSMAVKG